MTAANPFSPVVIPAKVLFSSPSSGEEGKLEERDENRAALILAFAGTTPVGLRERGIGPLVRHLKSQTQ